MTFEEKIISGIFVGLLVWLVTKTIGYLLTRERLKAGLLTDMEFHIKSIKESNEYLKEWLPTLQEGEPIKYSARHKADDYVLFNSLISDLPKYFSRVIFTNLLRYYKSIEEHDVLLEGFFSDVTIWKKEKRKLSAEDIRYLSRKMERITALGKILTKGEVKCLSQLQPRPSSNEYSVNTVINAGSSYHEKNGHQNQKGVVSMPGSSKAASIWQYANPWN